MKKGVKYLAIALLTGIALFGVACSSDTQSAGSSNQVSIGIIQYMDHVALDEAREGFVEALGDNGYVDGENLTINVQNAQGDQSNLSSISDQLVNENVDLVLAIATPAAQAIAGKTTEIPVVATAVTDYEAARLVDSNETPGGNVTGTTDMNPINEQIDLLIKLAPNAETVGVLYTSSEDNSIIQAGIAKEVIKDAGLKYEEVTVSNSNEVQQAMQALVGKCDAIYIPTDNVLASAMPVVNGVASSAKIPVITGETGMAKAGGLAGLGINYYDLGYQTGLMGVKILKGEAEPANMPIEVSNEFSTVINGDVAEEIGTVIPEELQEYIIKEN